MKTLGNKSLSKMLLTVIQVVWWLEWIVAIAIIAAVVTIPLTKRNVNFDTPVTFTRVTLKMVESAGTNLQAGRLNVTAGNFSFQVFSSLGNSLIMVLIVAVAFFFFISVTHQLKLIFESFTKHEPFVELNITRIRKIGFILICYLPARFIYEIALKLYLTEHFRWANDISLTYSFNLSALLIGLTLIVVAEIFKLGNTLENEQKLTI